MNNQINIEINDTAHIIGTIGNSDSIIATIGEEDLLTGVIGATPDLEGLISGNGSIQYEAIIGTSNSIPAYQGSYDITPRVTSQTLPTANKVMKKNVLVEEIPYFETANQYGDTIYIG